MNKGFVAVAAAAVILSAAALAPDRAQAGSSVSAPTKVNRTASVLPAWTSRNGRGGNVGITEISSSNRPPRR